MTDIVTSIAHAKDADAYVAEAAARAWTMSDVAADT